MSVELDISRDFVSLVDGQAGVTLRRSSGGEIGVSKAVLVSAVQTQPRAGTPAIVYEKATWEIALPADEPSPRLGDQIVAEGSALRITEVEQSRSLEFFRCVTQATRIRAPLINRVDIQEAAWDGVMLTGWRTIRAACPAVVELKETSSDHATTPPSSISRFRVSLADAGPLNHLHRLRTVDGLLLRVEKYQPAEAFDALPLVEATEINET